MLDNVLLEYDRQGQVGPTRTHLGREKSLSSQFILIPILSGILQMRKQSQKD